MNPRDIIGLARQLADGTSEAEWRAAIGRSYFGLFHVSSSLFQKLGFRIPRSESAHTHLSRSLCNSQHPLASQVGTALNDLRGRRNTADYDLDVRIVQSVAKASVSKAHDAVTLLTQLENDKTFLTMITDVIRIYERDILKTPTWQPPK